MIMTHNREKQTVDVDMKKYIASCVKELRKDEPDEKIRLVNTPATNFLFRTRDTQKLSKKRARIFHSFVAKLLFVVKRARPDILLAISFLKSRVKYPDIDDWGKLIRVIGYLMNTEGIHLTLCCKEIKDLVWYIDGSYATHDDMRGQSGAVLGLCSAFQIE
jgi:hypothetical protein